jgi:hypothetical protein
MGVVWCRMYSLLSGEGAVAGLCKYGNKYSCIILVARNFLTNRTTGSSSRRTLLQEVKQPTYLFVINFTDGLRSYEDCVSR